MATLPRAHCSKHFPSNTTSPFSTSPRKLQEMSFPAPEGHDVTTASGISMKQYEEQLNGLRKENFHLKLRVYFLEEKLGTGSPPAVQGLLEHNVRLQVEVEELRRQLSDKQELLAAAAEAIDVLEQQGSISTDSVEASLDNSAVVRRDNDVHLLQVPGKIDDDTCASESAGDYLAVTVNNEDLDELVRLRRENRKALQMIKGCMKKIQQQDKEIKKQKLDKELVYAQVSDSQLEKYEEILKCKDEHIKELETKIRDLQKYADNDVPNDDNSGNLQQLLTRRLQGLAFFLDKLLSHKCVLGEDKKKLAESILEQSLALPVGLQLDESMAPEDFTMDESTLDVSQSLRIEDLTLMFGHHLHCSDDNRRASRKAARTYPQADLMSESECWSEPDRNVSLARVGLCSTGVVPKESNSEICKYRTRRSRFSYGSRSEEKSINEAAYLEEISQLTKHAEQLEEEKNELNSKIEASQKQVEELVKEKENMKSALADERLNVSEALKNLEATKVALVSVESRVKDVEYQLKEAIELIEKMRNERQELEGAFLETERSLRRAADEATVQASQAALERARAQHDRLRVERELEETRDKLSAAMEAKAQMEIEAARKHAHEANKKIEFLHEAQHSEEERPTSPDQGIDSDRLSSLEQNEVPHLSPRLLYEENVTLKQKLARTKTTLAETVALLNAANIRKRSVQYAICREIHKTQGVLRKARDQFENQN